MQSAKSRETALHLHIGIDHVVQTHIHLHSPQQASDRQLDYGIRRGTR
jgi:hypothetical protein